MSRLEDSAPRRFRPSRDGLAQVLGDLEAEIMEHLSLRSGAVAARAVADAVGTRRGVQHITVVTVLNNLCRKGLLRREREGRAFRYEVALARDEYLRSIRRNCGV